MGNLAIEGVPNHQMTSKGCPFLKHEVFWVSFFCKQINPLQRLRSVKKANPINL
jgi:hypothetical protein